MNVLKACSPCSPAWTTRPGYELIRSDDMPQPYRDLLVQHHMTVTVEAHHGGPVDVRVLAYRQDGDLYSRKILLALQGTGRVVQFGIVRIDLTKTTPAVRDAILARDTPVGRILIRHNVLRRIEPTAFLRITPGPEQMAWFGMKEPAPLYGRLAIIHFDGRPAVELLEVVAP
ncbi:MAG: hypothetical protein U0797_29220 [Gemmataceae bacterium]